MAIKQSDWAAGRKQAPVSHEAGTVKCERYTFTITADLAANDIIELACLPPYHTVVEAIFDPDETGTATFDVGLMSGVFGSTDQARTIGNELFAGAADATVARITKSAGLRIAPTDQNRSIGVKVVGAGITAANQVISLLLFTKQ